jgi:lipoprotein-anchoring transpeptidase ErfK/SrfK
MSGGPRPDVSPARPERISFVSSYAPGTIVIDTSGRRLYLVQSSRDALVYPISVGREGFTWTGTERISRIANWPDWHPPAEMRQRQPHLPVKMTGGVYNPLGAKAMYLGNSLYRIHGTDDARTIGRATSSGCFRMTNGHVTDLSRRVGVGTTVVVVNRLSARTAGY